MEGNKVLSTDFDLLSIFGGTKEPTKLLEKEVRKQESKISSTSSPPASKQPPKGVPVMSKFKKNRDGSITGFISGSKNFEEGEKITTSKLAPGQVIEAGNVIQTISGSKYFLS